MSLREKLRNILGSGSQRLGSWDLYPGLAVSCPGFTPPSLFQWRNQKLSLSHFQKSQALASINTLRLDSPSIFSSEKVVKVLITHQAMLTAKSPQAMFHNKEDKWQQAARHRPPSLIKCGKEKGAAAFRRPSALLFDPDCLYSVDRASENLCLMNWGYTSNRGK